MPIKTRPWDAAEHLETPDDIAAYIGAVLEDGDPHLVAAAIGDIARARGMTQLARETGLSRESLYRGLSTEGNPEFGTVLKVLHALGIKLEARPLPRKDPASVKPADKSVNHSGA
jgi:probable addiction module antidote protein